MPDDDEHDPLDELMDSTRFNDDDVWVSTHEQKADIGRDVSERDGHPVSDLMPDEEVTDG